MAGWRPPCRFIAPLVAVAVMMMAGPASSVTNNRDRMEARVLAALNYVRVNPQGYVDGLRAYRNGFKRMRVQMPGSRIFYVTREGTRPVDQALRFLSKEAPRSKLRASPLLAAAAADHAAEQSQSGRVGHFSHNGFSPADRIARRGGGRIVSEVIVYGAFDAPDVVRQLIVDDGVPDRGHRSAMFATKLRYAGVACDRHPTFRTMCVIEMAETPDGSRTSAAATRMTPRAS